MANWEEVKFDFDWRKDNVNGILLQNLTAEEKLKRLSVNPCTGLNVIDYVLQYGKDLKYFFEPELLEDDYGDDFYDFFNESYYDLNFSAISDLIEEESDSIDAELLKKTKHALYMRDALSSLYGNKFDFEEFEELGYDEDEIVEILCSFYDEVIAFVKKCADYEYGKNKTLRKQYVKQQETIFTSKISFVNVNVSTQLMEYIESVRNNNVETDAKLNTVTKGDDTQEQDEQAAKVKNDKTVKEEKQKTAGKNEKEKVDDGIKFKPGNEKRIGSIISLNITGILRYVVVVLWGLIFTYLFSQFAYVGEYLKLIGWLVMVAITVLGTLKHVITSNISILVNFDINADYVEKISSYDDAMKFVRKVKRKSIGNAIREVIWPIITGLISYACVSAIALIVSKTVPFVAYLYDFAILDLIIAVPLHALMLLIVYLWILAKHVGNKRAIAIIERLTDTCFWSKCPQCGGLIVHEILEKWTEKGKMIAPERNEWVSNKNTTSYYEVNGERVTVTEKDYGGHWEKHEAVYEVLTIAKLKETCRQCKSTQIIERDVTTALEKQKKYLEKYLQDEKHRGKSLPKETPVKEKTYEKYKKM